MPLVELFDPLPQELADLIQREDVREVFLWVSHRLSASQRDIDDFRAAHQRLDQLYDASAPSPKEPPDLVRYHEELDQLAGLAIVWLKRLLAARTIGLDSGEWPAASLWS
jgi:hypothetical protein